MEAVIANTIIGSPGGGQEGPRKAIVIATLTIVNTAFCLRAQATSLHYSTGTFWLILAYVLLSRMDPSEV